MEHITIKVNHDLLAYNKYNTGDVIFIPTTTTHKVVMLMGNNEVRTIFYNVEVLKSISLQIDFSELFHKREQYIITSQNNGYKEICNAIENIYELEDDFSIGGRIKIVSNLLQIISQIIQEFHLEMCELEKDYVRIRPVLDYIEQNFMRKITVSELSKIVHICNDALIILFKKATGITPAKYILNLRIEESVSLLTSTELSLEEIAERTGFGSSTYMNRIFKQKLGCTPGKFRSK